MEKYMKFYAEHDTKTQIVRETMKNDGDKDTLHCICTLKNSGFGTPCCRVNQMPLASFMNWAGVEAKGKRGQVELLRASVHLVHSLFLFSADRSKCESDAKRDVVNCTMKMS